MKRSRAGSRAGALGADVGVGEAVEEARREPARRARPLRVELLDRRLVVVGGEGHLDLVLEQVLARVFVAEARLDQALAFQRGRRAVRTA
jgi:hypothetical protein